MMVGVVKSCGIDYVLFDKIVIGVAGVDCGVVEVLLLLILFCTVEVSPLLVVHMVLPSLFYLQVCVG